MSPWKHLLVLGCSAALLGGCATAPIGSQGERVPPAATLGPEVELFARPPLEISVAVGGSGVAHVAAITASGTLQHLIVGQEGGADRNVLGEVNRDDVLDMVVGPDGTVHLLVGTRYLTFSGAGRNDTDAGGCERITVTPAQALCSIPVDAAGVPIRLGAGRFDGLGTARIRQATKFVISRLEERTWSTVAALEPDSDWDILTANVVATNNGVVHLLYLAEGPVSRPPRRRMVRFATFRVPESSARPPETIGGVDVWELVPGTEPPVVAETLAAGARSGVPTFWRRYGLPEPAADRTVIALARPAGRAYTMLRAHQSSSALLADASDVLLVRDGQLLRELPTRPENSSWTSFVLSTLVAAAGAGRFHVVSVSKDDLLGFDIRARYLQIIEEGWSTPLDLGRVSDRVDLAKLGAGEDGRAFVVLPAIDGRVVGRWIKLQR